MLRAYRYHSVKKEGRKNKYKKQSEEK